MLTVRRAAEADVVKLTAVAAEAYQPYVPRIGRDRGQLDDVGLRRPAHGQHPPSISVP